MHEDNNFAYGLIYTTTDPDIAVIPEVGTGVGYLVRNLIISADPDIQNVFIPNYKYVEL